MNRPSFHILKVKETHRDPKTGSKRYTATLGSRSIPNLTKEEVAELRLWRYAATVLDKAHARGLFYIKGKRAIFTDLDAHGDYLPGVAV